MRTVVFVLFAGLISSQVSAVKLGSVARFSESGTVPVSGYGLVVGLSGTGDSSRNELTKQLLEKYLANLGTQLSGDVYKAKNTALVLVSGELKSGAVKGDRITVKVMSVLDARSIKDGVLLPTPLKTPSGDVVAVASGKVDVSGSKGGSGNVYMGAVIVKNFDSAVSNTITVVLNGQVSVSRLVKTIKAKFKNLNVSVGSSRILNVSVPDGRNPVEFIEELKSLEVEVEPSAVVVVDRKSGAVVIGGGVSLSPAAISYKGLKIEISGKEGFSEFGLKEGHIAYIDSPTVSELVNALNSIGVESDDLINILKLLKEAGCLYADIRVM